MPLRDGGDVAEGSAGVGFDCVWYATFWAVHVDARTPYALADVGQESTT